MLPTGLCSINRFNDTTCERIDPIERNWHISRIQRSVVNDIKRTVDVTHKCFWFFKRICVSIVHMHRVHIVHSIFITRMHSTLVKNGLGFACLKLIAKWKRRKITAGAACRKTVALCKLESLLGVHVGFSLQSMSSDLPRCGSDAFRLQIWFYFKECKLAEVGLLRIKTLSDN